MNDANRDPEKSFTLVPTRGLKDITPNLPTKLIPAKIRRFKISGRFPMGLGIPPLNIKILLESKPLISRILVRRLAVYCCIMCAVLLENGIGMETFPSIPSPSHASAACLGVCVPRGTFYHGSQHSLRLSAASHPHLFPTRAVVRSPHRPPQHKSERAKPRRATKEGQWILRAPLHIRTLVVLCSAWF